MVEDAELLRRYAHEKSQDAFGELVRRRVDLVYTVALRQVGGDVHLAEDVTQKVFVDLARKAAEVARRPVLTGWLYRSAQYAASDVVRAERRRRAREEESHAMHETASGPAAPAEWEKLRPLLDEAMAELDDPDRDAVALRFFEARPFAEIGAALRLTEDAARKRVERALDRLAAGLARRGITSTSAALALALGGQTMVAAPVGLAATVTQAALAGALSTAAVGGLLFGFMGTKTTIGIAVAFAALATGAAVYQKKQADENHAAFMTASQRQEDMQAKLRELESRLAAADARARAAEDDNARLLQAIDKAKASRDAAQVAATPAIAAISQESVNARYRRAQELARAGNWEAALPDLLWCYDEGMVRIPSFTGVRLSFLLGELGRMAKNYPPALTALRERRDKAAALMMTSANERQAASEFASLNHAIGEDAKTLELFDRLPASDSRKSGLAYHVVPFLMDAQRYADVMEAQPYDRMTAQFDMLTSREPDFARLPDAERARKVHRTGVVANAAKNVEALAGAGDLVRAKEFAAKILAYDNTAETRSVLQRHAARAGHPNLIEDASR